MADHRWTAPLGVTTAYVNGVSVRFPLVCRDCLVRDDRPAADLPCDRLVAPLPAAPTEEPNPRA